MSKVNFWIFGFIETKRFNIDSFENKNWNKFKGQHQCNSIDLWTFFLGWRKGIKKKRFEDVFGHVFKFPVKFCHWQISQNGGTGAIFLQRVFLRHALELPQIWSWNKIVYYATRAYSITLRTSADRPSVWRSTPELHTLFYAILCGKFDITSVPTEMRNHPRQSEMAGYMGGKRGRMGRRSGSRGAAPDGGLRGGAPPLAEKYFFILEKKRKY